jgi:hypothetical protein
LNSIKGGYAIAIASHIAFLPKGLCKSRKKIHSQWKKISILNMNPKINNIVIKDIDDGKIDFFSPAKVHKKKKPFGHKAKIVVEHKKPHFFISMKKN